MKGQKVFEAIEFPAKAHAEKLTQAILAKTFWDELVQARPLMESAERPEIKVFNHAEGPKDKGIRRYIWLENYDYVLILQRRKKAFFWITASYVDMEWKRKDLEKRFAERAQ